MGLRKTDGMANVTIREWNQREARRCIRNRIIVQCATIIIGIAVVAFIINLLYEQGII